MIVTMGQNGAYIAPVAFPKKTEISQDPFLMMTVTMSKSINLYSGMESLQKMHLTICFSLDNIIFVAFVVDAFSCTNRSQVNVI